MMASDSVTAVAAVVAADPVEARLAQLVRRLADENRALLGLMRCGWSLEEAARALQRGSRRPDASSPPPYL